MKRLFALVLAAAMVLPGCRPAEEAGSDGDFAVLAQAAEGYAEAQPGQSLEFPRDHGAHPDFRIEWWYLTANLEGDDGQRYGAQWTLFRTAVRSPAETAPANPWQSGQVYMAHFALTGPAEHHGFQRYARGGSHGGEARSGVTAEPFAAWLDDWELRSTGAGFLPLEASARQQGHAMQLVLTSDRPMVLQGDAGFSQKHPGGGGSFYYSHPFLQASGALTIDGREIGVRGEAWLDREWSSQFLQSDQEGWDWFSLHLDSGEKLMMFRLRALGIGEDFLHGVLIAPDGNKQALEPGQINLEVLQRERVAGRDLPLNWRVSLPGIGRDFTVRALHPDQWMDVDFPYWEGVVVATGEGSGNTGVGYLEMTGYTD